MASEQGDPETLPSGIEEWITEYTEETGDSRETVLARAVASYRLLAEDRDEDDAVESLLSDLESRIETLESETGGDRIDQIEADLDDHVADLRSRIVDVMKEARKRAPAEHSHEELDQLAEIEAEFDSVQSQIEAHESTIDELEQGVTALEDQADNRLGELGSISESVDTVESKADRLAGVVVDLRRRLGRVESHITHQTALAELLETAAREDIEKARCDNCGEMVKLPMLVEPACPHCRSVFDGVEPGSMFFKSAWLTVADRPALEAGTTTEAPFDATESENDASNNGQRTNR